MILTIININETVLVLEICKFEILSEGDVYYTPKEIQLGHEERTNLERIDSITITQNGKVIYSFNKNHI